MCCGSHTKLRRDADLGTFMDQLMLVDQYFAARGWNLRHFAPETVTYWIEQGKTAAEIWNIFHNTRES